ncbi:MAG: hypothetical protein AAGC47_07755 [Bacteroidota bacterium]
MKYFFTSLLILFLAAIASSQYDSGFNDDFAIGFQLGQHQRDFGFGINATSPHFVSCLGNIFAET